MINCCTIIIHTINFYRKNCFRTKTYSALCYEAVKNRKLQKYVILIYRIKSDFKSLLLCEI